MDYSSSDFVFSRSTFKISYSTWHLLSLYVHLYTTEAVTGKHKANATHRQTLLVYFYWLTALLLLRLRGILPIKNLSRGLPLNIVQRHCCRGIWMHEPLGNPGNPCKTRRLFVIFGFLLFRGLSKTTTLVSKEVLEGWEAIVSLRLNYLAPEYLLQRPKILRRSSRNWS